MVPKGKAKLVGNYGPFGWLGITTPIDIPANEPIKLMSYVGMPIPVSMLREEVKIFQCGIEFDEEFAKENPDAIVQLRLVNRPENEQDNWSRLEEFVFPFVPKTPSSSHPKTGDSFPVLPVLCTAVISLAGMYVCGMNVRRKYQR